ncbi:unnamed protein product [Cyprideis torosa]|uniref:Uncharacterized protein n=1 Tax=Cyprideis torosa TaxID=163714 RepID=A0A7R8W0R0_9CRUS|nr:unnamed protein product [Cyprideis torosa]CAG0880003.1 unnamed protein product [Cyprideis torosa]
MKVTLVFGVLSLAALSWARPTEEEKIILFADNREVDSSKLIENTEDSKGPGFQIQGPTNVAVGEDLKEIILETKAAKGSKYAAPEIIGEYVDEITFGKLTKGKSPGKTGNIEKKKTGEGEMTLEDLKTTDGGIALNELEPAEFLWSHALAADPGRGHEASLILNLSI